jgi:hypothetical protein
MSPIHVLHMAPEIWLKISSYSGSDSIYPNDDPHSGPGAGTVGPLPSSAPPNSVEGDIKAFLSLRIRHKDGKMGYYRASDFIPDSDSSKQGTVVEVHELATLPLRNHIRHLRLILRDSSYDSDINLMHRLVYGDDATCILDRTPCLQTLEVSVRYTGWVGEFFLSTDFCRALSRCNDLRVLQLQLGGNI